MGSEKEREREGGREAGREGGRAEKEGRMEGERREEQILAKWHLQVHYVCVTPKLRLPGKKQCALGGLRPKLGSSRTVQGMLETRAAGSSVAGV